MATRQYIGARYVPKFFENGSGTSEWTANTAYEALTIVTRNGNSYTSKIPVPASVGAPELNPTYWASTGIFNSQVEEYRQEVEGYREEVSDYTSRLEALEREADTIGDNGIWLFVGDSYLTRTVNPATYIANWTGKTYGSDIVVSAYSGCGFNYTVDGHNFNQLAQSASISNPEQVSRVIFCGGCNDIFEGSLTGLISAIATALKNAKTKYPNAKLYVADNEVWITDAYPWSQRDQLYRYYQAGCAQGNGHFLGAVGTECKLYPNMFLDDDLKHPNADGMQNIALCIMENISGIEHCGGYATTGVQMGFKIEGDVIRVNWYGNYTYALTDAIASLTANGGTEISIPIANCNIKQPGSQNREFFQITGGIRAEGNWQLCTFNAYFNHTGLIVKPWIAGSPTLINVTQIAIPAGTNTFLSGHTIG